MIRGVVLAVGLFLPTIAQAQTAGLDCPKLAAADRASYMVALRSGGEANRERHYAQAEIAYRQALDLQAKGCGRDNPAVVFALSHVALQQSNLGHFAEAEANFARVDALLPAVAPSVRSRALHNRALNAANQLRYADALVLADSAAEVLLQVAPALRLVIEHPPLRPIGFDRPQLVMAPRTVELEGTAQAAAPALRAIYASSAYWAGKLGETERAARYRRQAQALAETIQFER